MRKQIYKLLLSEPYCYLPNLRTLSTYADLHAITCLSIRENQQAQLFNFSKLHLG